MSATTELPPLAAGEGRWPACVAMNIARDLCAALRPLCRRIEIAGSLRRRKSMVGDIEILYIPRIETRPLPDAFLLETEVDLVEEKLNEWLGEGLLRKRLLKEGRTAWGHSNKLATHPSGVPVDFFRTTEAAWWNYLVCRTGPASSNMAIATQARERGYKWNPYDSGYTRLSDGVHIPMRSEEEVFKFLDLKFKPPEER